MSFKLKFDNINRVNEDTRHATSELAERYGETQRENLRLKSRSDEMTIELESQKNELIQSKQEIKDMKDTSLNIIQRNNDLLNQLEQIKESHELVLKQLVDVNELEKQSLIDKIHSLELENQFMSNQLESTNELSNQLEEYKKRAQNALKKSNEITNNLEKEKMMLIQSYDMKLINATTLISQMEEDYELQVKDLKNKMNDLYEDVKMKEELISKLEQEVSIRVNDDIE